MSEQTISPPEPGSVADQRAAQPTAAAVVPLADAKGGAL